jgi:tyrosinase
MQRQEYVQAVLCLMSLPAKTKSQAPGARTRFDDYVVVHIQKTPIAHNNVCILSPYMIRLQNLIARANTLLLFQPQAFFLPWHRYYIWHYEQALRNECGYTGYQPVSIISLWQFLFFFLYSVELLNQK